MHWVTCRFVISMYPCEVGCGGEMISSSFPEKDVDQYPTWHGQTDHLLSHAGDGEIFKCSRTATQTSLRLGTG
jgi:hypothetical protein